ncbi:hypothetical protein SLS59_005929 [Nothophoma quercina]|uniref:DENN-domain-containing protein n=1 Tax=Nothophoma quercina TaxID=749835 RepID=A0ABR3R7F4_9PLEO
MAPISSAEGSSAPLADYFFISGIESSQVYDERLQPNGIVSPLASPPVDETIEEDRALETDSIRPTSQDGLPNGGSTRRRSGQRLSENRQSVGTITGIDSKPTVTASNRSSATIKGLNLGGSGLSDVDFENALRKFASERDTFLEEIQFTAGVAQQSRQTPTRPRPRPPRVSQAPSVNGEDASIRTSKRMSGYNSVIPVPQPFHPEPNMHPLLRRYEPVLLDRYPPRNMVEELKRRNPFPDYVPMFAFPNDVSVVSSDERPKTQWHGFAMTNGDSSKLYGITMVVWLPLNATAAEGLERQCEEWRRNHMNPEERELASSLGERLALERAKLSQLLAKLPTVQPDSDERENLDEEIGAVEEKIQLMTDLLRPVRHGAASKIEGLTDGETGLWIPRAYGVMGRDASLTPLWKEWLKAIVVPMTNGTILRVPPSSPRVGMWQPLERYVVNLCAEALSPITSITQVELAVRELRMYARKEALNEIPGSRNIDIYALFRCLSIQNIVTLFEYVLSEARIILLSSHTAMLHLASMAITNLIYPFQWCGVFIPVLPARLVQTIEAPCPYIVGIERRYEPTDYPDDDFVLVDLDQNSIVSNGPPPPPLPRQQRRKLISLLQHSAPHHMRYGVPTGPPAYAVEAFPHDTFCSENPGVFTPKAHPSTVQTYVGLNSTSFGTVTGPASGRPLIYNAFIQSGAHSRGNDRPSTSSTVRTFSNSPPSPKVSPVSTVFPPMPSTPISRSDSGYALQANLREKRSAHFDTQSRRSSSFGFEKWRPHEDKATCSICEEKSDEGLYRCSGCTTYVHARCAPSICIVCPTAFRPDQVRASFVRCFASLLYTYRRYLVPASGDRKKSGMHYQFKMEEFMKAQPAENVQYLTALQQTQSFNEFIHERESTSGEDPKIKLFDEVILAKKNRGASSYFYKTKADFLSDTSDHLWRTAHANPPTSRFPGDYRAVVSRIPAKLDITLMKEPRVIQGVPRPQNAKARRKPIPSMLSNGVPAS